MFNKQKFIIGVIVVSSIFISQITQASSFIAISCEQSVVQAVINTAVNGDTVFVPAGSCTWSSPVTIPDSKKIKLQGSGIGKTVITATNGAVSAGFSGSRITGFEFDLSTSKSGVDVRGSGWRVDNCKFSNPGTTTTSNGVYATGSSTNSVLNGLVDNCIFLNAKVLVLANMALIAHEVWAKPLGLGTSSAVYVENNTFTFNKSGNCLDANYGGAYVFRYNTVNDTTVEAHSLQSTSRAARKFEIYNNTFNRVSRSMWAPIFVRGGTGVIFNNTVTGTWTDPNIKIDNRRSCESLGDGGICNGTSPWDGNETGKSGYPCRDQIGRSTDAHLWTDANPYPPQALEPAYAWNNKHGAEDVVFSPHGCTASQAHIQHGRDYYNNIQKPGYTPYEYPHPLTHSWDSLLGGSLPKPPGIISIQ